MARSNQTSHAELYAERHGGYMHINDQRLSPGRRLYVSSVLGGTAGGDGDSPENPLSTIQGAIALSATGNYDQIVVMPGHAETLAAAGAIDTTGFAGVRIVGIGLGSGRPTLTFTDVAATVLVASANVTFENFIFVTGVADVVTMISVQGTDLHLKNCEFRPDATLTMETLTYITVGGGGANAADGFWLDNCRLFSPAAGATQAISISQVNDRVIIEESFMCCDCTAAVVWSDQILTTFLLKHNVIHSLAAGVHAVELTTTATGVISDNHLYGDTLGTILDPGNCFCVGNLEVDAIDQAAIPTPGITAGPFLTNAFDADSIAADALTAAKIANAALDGATYANDVGVWRKAISDYSFAVDTGAQAAYTVFTVTGDVVVRCVATCGDTITSGGAPTMELGVAGNTACLIAQIVDGTDLIVNEIWHDATPTTTCELIDLPTTHNCILSNGQDIQFLIGNANVTAGIIDFYCLWYPLSADGNVVAA